VYAIGFTGGGQETAAYCINDIVCLSKYDLLYNPPEMR